MRYYITTTRLFPLQNSNSPHGIEVKLISLKHLKINKKASGKHKDLNDLENLP